MKSDGGLARPHVASTRPITQTISGPVAGVKAAQFFADSTDIQNIITFDMGGTSCDTALVQDGTPVEEPHRKIQGLKINGPFVSINTVGAGGGSIAWLDEVDALRVGPRSSGATPGPACYGRGGTEPTVTDANLVLGVLNPSNFAGGEMDLDVDAARASLEPIAEALGVGIERAAVAVRSVVDSNLASAIRVVSVKEGYDPREFALMAFGGAGPAHACNVADKLDIDTVIFPANSGLFSATGLLQSDIRHEYVQSIVKLADAVDSGRLDDRVDAMVEDANEELSSERVPPADRSFQISFDAQYEGQAHYLTVPLGGTTVNDAALSAFADRFEEMHESRFGFRDEENPIEIVNIRVTATGAIGLDDVRTERDTESGGENAAKRGERTVRLSDDRTVTAPHYEWERLSPEATIDGPAIVEARNSTAWIAPAFDATVRPDGTLLARRGAHE
jgi:N-methylhydantoinase A